LRPALECAQAFLDIAPTLSEYGVYVSNFKNCQSGLLRLKDENAAFGALVQRIDKTQGASLSALLSQPVNHISKLCTELEVSVDPSVPPPPPPNNVLDSYTAMHH
jgi:hypothetical protein